MRQQSTFTDSKQQRMHAYDLKKNPPKKSTPRLEKGLSQQDRKAGWKAILNLGRATS